MDKEWTPFMGYDSLRIELRYRHIWQTKWSDVDRRTNTMDNLNSNASGGAGGVKRGMAPGPRGRRARSLNRNVHYDRTTAGNNGYDEEFDDDLDQQPPSPAYYSSSSPRSSMRGGSRGGGRGGGGGGRHYRSADNFMEGGIGDDRDMHIVVRGGVYEVDLAEWKCYSLYWPGEAFDIMRGTWFYEHTWQPVQCEYADKIEQEHLNRFLGHKMADYVWDSSTSQRLEKQVS